MTTEDSKHHKSICYIGKLKAIRSMNNEQLHSMYNEDRIYNDDGKIVRVNKYLCQIAADEIKRRNKNKRGKRSK